MMKKAYVTGASGFVGTHLCEELKKNGYEVNAIVRPGSLNTERLGEIKIISCGMDDYDKLIGDSADVFFHLAWEGTTGTGRDDEDLQIRNIQRTAAALRAAKRLGCKRFVALGTVYEKLVPQILAEPLHRKADFYLLAKHSAHEMCIKLAEKLEIEFVWATIFQPLGKYIKHDQVMAYTINSLIAGTSPKYGPAREPYDILAVEDLAMGLRLIGECNGPKKEYYIGSGSPMLMKDYLEKTKEVLNSDTELNIGAMPDDGLRFSFDWYDIISLQEDTGYAPKTGFDQAVRNAAEWLCRADN